MAATFKTVITTMEMKTLKITILKLMNMRLTSIAMKIFVKITIWTIKVMEKKMELEISIMKKVEIKIIAKKMTKLGIIMVLIKIQIMRVYKLFKKILTIFDSKNQVGNL